MSTDLRIVKTELFDPDVMEAILNDPSFSKKDRDRLSRYKKGRKHSNQVEVVYHYGKGCEELDLGRLYPHEYQGLQSFPFDIRNPLIDKYYWDIDMANCHYVILSKLADKWGLPNDAIKQYIANRDDELSRVSSTRHIAKTAFLKIAYGGNIRLHNDWHDDDGIAEGDLTLVRKIEKEMNCIVERVWNDNKLYHKLVSRKKNPKFSLFAYVLQTEERKCLLAIDGYLRGRGRSVDILIHDGCEVRKLDGEVAFHEELLRGAEQAILDATGYSHTLAVKPIKHNFVMKKELSLTEKAEVMYADWKSTFEEEHFEYKPANVIIGFGHDDRVVTYDDAHAKQVMNVDQLPTCKKSGDRHTCIERWLKDAKRRQVDRLVYKYPEDCSPREGNLFRGFAYAKTKPCEPELEKQVVDTFLDILKCVCNDEEESFQYVLKWMAHIIQKPFQKTLVGVCLINQEKGTGKDTISSWFREVVGSVHSSHYTSESQFWEKHDPKKEGGILMYLEEIGGGLNHEHNDDLKALITSSSLSINKKNVKQYDVPNLGNYLMTSNRQQPVKIEDGDRRFFLIQGSLRLWKKYDYWREFYKASRLNSVSEPVNPDWIGPVGRYLERLDITGYSAAPPLTTEHMRTILESKRDPIRSFLEAWTGTDVRGPTLYAEYVAFCDREALHRACHTWSSLSSRMAGFPLLYRKTRDNRGNLYSYVEKEAV